MEWAISLCASRVRRWTCLSRSGLLLSCCLRSTSLDSAFWQRRAPLPIIETQKSPWIVSDEVMRQICFQEKSDVTVWIIQNLFFQTFNAQKLFFAANSLPCTTSSASALPRRLIWQLLRSTTFETINFPLRVGAGSWGLGLARRGAVRSSAVRAPYCFSWQVFRAPHSSNLKE